MVILNAERRFDRVKFQFLAIFCANIITLSHGCVLGWMSPFLPLLQSEYSPLKMGPISLVEASWVGAIICIGGVIGNFSFGLLVSRFGSQRGISLLAFPQLGFWLFVMFGQTVEHLYVARTFAGITGGGVFICIPLYVAEISDDHVRGTLGSLLLMNCNIGVLLSFIAGAYLDYSTVPYIMIILPIVFFCCFSFLPQTPQHLLKLNRVQDAEDSLRFYRNCRDKTKQECQKFKQDFDRLKMIAQYNETDDERLRFSDLCTPAARHGLMIGVCLMAINQFSGCFALINYSATIFRDSGSDLNPNVSSIILATVQIVGVYVSTILVDRVGRKILLIVSAASTSVGLAVMGLYSFVEQHGWNVSALDWVPVTSLSFVIFIASIGILPLPFVVLAEVLPQNIRAIGSTICVTSISLISFLILKTFPILSNVLGLYGCFWLFSTICVLGTVFIVFCVDETRGKSLNTVKARGMSIY